MRCCLVSTDADYTASTTADKGPLHQPASKACALYDDDVKIRQLGPIYIDVLI